MGLRTSVVVGLVLALTATVSFAAVAPAGGATTGADCQTIDDQKVCIQDVSTPETLIIGGENGTVSVTIENVGQEEVSPLVVLNTVDPDNETSTFQIGQPTLAPGESTTVTQPLNATTPGTHGVQVVLADSATGQRYDISEAAVIEVREEPAPGLGGPIDRTEIALVALLGVILGMAVPGLRLRG